MNVGFWRGFSEFDSGGQIIFFSGQPINSGNNFREKTGEEKNKFL